MNATTHPEAEALHVINRTLRMISECHQMIIRATSEPELLGQICRHFVESGGYRMTWVGLVDRGAPNRIRLVSHLGGDVEFLKIAQTLCVCAAPKDTLNNISLRTGQPVVCPDLRTDFLGLGREEALRRGYRSALVLPLLVGGDRLGALTIFAAVPDAFDPQEVKLLKVLADDLAFGMVALRNRNAGRRAEESLRRSAEEIQDLYNHAPCGYHSLDADGVVVRINDTELEWLGYRREEVIGKMKFTQFLNSDGLQVFHSFFPQLKAKGSVRDIKFDLIRRDGTALPVVLNATAVMDARGRFVMTRSVVNDITERTRAEQERRAHLRFVESLNRVNDAIQGANDLEQMMSDVLDVVLAIFDCDRAWLLYPCDPKATSWQARMERTRPEYPGALALGIEIPVDSEVIRAYEKVTASGGPVTFGPGSEHPLTGDVAKRFQIQSQLAMAIYPKTEKPYMFGLHQCSYPRVWTSDEQKLFQEIGRRLSDGLTSLLMNRNLRRSERQVRTLVENSPDVIIRYDREGRRIYANPAFLAVAGIPEEKLMGVSPAQLSPLSPRWAASLQDLIHQAIESGTPGAIDFPMQKGDSELWYEVQVVPEFDGRGQVVSAMCIGRDITKRKRAEEEVRALNASLERRVQERTRELAQSEERFRTIYETAPVSIWLEDWTQVIEAIEELQLEGVSDLAAYFHNHSEFVRRALAGVKILNVNEWTLEMFGAQDKEEMLASLAIIFNTPETLPGFIRELIAPAQGQRVYRTELAMNRVDGKIIHGLLAMSFPAPGTGSGQVLVSVSDVTELKRAEEKIRKLNEELQYRAAMLESANKELESFSYSVSHDLRAPLRSIDGFTQILLENHASQLKPEGVDCLHTILTATRRMGQLIEDMLRLAKVTRCEICRAPVDLSALAGDVARELQSAGPERTVEFIVAPQLIAQADDQLMRIVLVNLLGNAWKFTSKQPAARIEFGRTTHEGAPVYFVSDNGVGFDMAYAQRLFGAFQRLHSVKEFPGTGVGLATVQRIIQRHGGRVWAESIPGQGATFYFTLPS